VPVGADQKQNIEITRDTAMRFNHVVDRDVLPIPEAYILDDVAVVPGLDGRKMSKSYGNTIGIFDEGKDLKQKVMSIVTDSTPLEEPKDPERDNVFALISLFADEEDRERIASAYRSGGYGYGHAKKELLKLINETFGEARERRRDLASDPDFVMDVLRSGARKARARSEKMMDEVRHSLGLLRAHRPTVIDP
jgi:tryptophanyl-tRNA synthetase